MSAHRIVRILTITGITAFIAWCIADTFFITVPFWIDEWRIIYNLKTRSVAELWSPLDFMQQAPRAYLSFLKMMSDVGDYGYTALRLPALLVSCTSVWLVWRLMQRLFDARDWRRYLFVLILVSSVPVTKYAVQVKQYPADILMGLVALWQGLQMWQVLQGEDISSWRFMLLGGSLIAAPFFSYTYPIALAPAFLAVAIAWLRFRPRRLTSLRLILFASVSLAAIILVWLTDTRYAVTDPQMRGYWHTHLWGSMSSSERLRTTYTVFSQIGAGDFFSYVFGLLGLAALGWSVVRLAHPSASIASKTTNVDAFMRLYSLSALAVAWLLFMLGKLPLGEARLNTFLTPAIAWMIVDFLDGMERMRKKAATATATVLTILLYAGTVGNLFTTIVAEYTDGKWLVKRRIYNTVGEAIRTVRIHRLPILATPRIAFPEEAHDNVPFPEKMPGDWVLKTHPDYHFADSIRVYRLGHVNAAGKLRNLPEADTAAVVCAGDTAFVVRRF